MTEWFEDLSNVAPSAMYYDYCIPPVLSKYLAELIRSITICCVFSWTCKWSKTEGSYHAINISLGLILLASNSMDSLYFALCFILISYWLLHTWQMILHFSVVRGRTYMVYGVFSLGFIIYGELYDNVYVFSIRDNRWMILTAIMKIYSYSQVEMPDMRKSCMVEFFSYMLCPANVLNGVWQSFESHMKQYENRKQFKWNSKRVVSLCTYTVYGIACSLLGECFVVELFNYPQYMLLNVLRKTLALRLSYYAKVYRASAVSVAAGFEDEEDDPSYTLIIPIMVEAPRSLITALCALDVQTYLFMYNHVFFVFKRNSNMIWVLNTCLVTLFICHDQNELLLTISMYVVFCQAQNAFQDRLSEYLSACVTTMECDECNHEYGPGSWYTKIWRTVLSAVSYVLMNYLLFGIDKPSFLESKSAYYNALERWGSLYYVGHFIIMVYAVGAYLI